MDMQLETDAREMAADVKRNDGHIENPKCYPPRDPELARRSKPGDDSKISKGGPLLRALEGEATTRGDKCQNGEKRLRKG